MEGFVLRSSVPTLPSRTVLLPMARSMKKKIDEKELANHLTTLLKVQITVKDVAFLGEGWHNIGYMVTYLQEGEEKRVVLRIAKGKELGHEYPADRARLFLMQHYHAKFIPSHIASLDVGCVMKGGKLNSLSSSEDFFQLVEEVKGEPYYKDLIRIRETGLITPEDKKKTMMLSDYLIDLHGQEYQGSDNEILSLKRRHTRDCIGHGEMFIGVIDTYPDTTSFVTKEELIAIAQRMIALREEVKDKVDLCRMHGDFHPGNLFFTGKGVTVLDASRALWGSAADDVSCLGINYLWYALMHTGSFSGPFMDLFSAYWENYEKKTHRKDLPEVSPLFFAFRGVVIAHPLFYPEQGDTVRKNVMRFIKNVLKAGTFDHHKVKSYLS